MPELPDIELYRTRLRESLVGNRLERLVFHSLFVLRSVAVKPADLEGRLVVDIERLGKRLVIALEGDAFIVIHLMIAGRLTWVTPAPPMRRAVGKIMLASLQFSNGLLSLQEISTKKRAAIHLVQGRAGLEEHRRDGIDVRSASFEEFAAQIRRENRTLKRLLTSPALFDGIGNAYSDEILFNARLSPVRRSGALSDEEVERLRVAAKSTLESWIERLPAKYPAFPKPSDITAFRPEFAVHGRFGQPCPVCGSPVQRIVYAENETNYCARCQNEGRLLADRSLSRLLKDDWPKTLEEMVGQ